MSLESILGFAKKAVLPFAFFGASLFPQKSMSQAFTGDDAKSALYTIGLQTAFSVAGALIKKKPVGEALKWGAISGTMNYSAKYMVSRSDKLFWPARIISQTGTNMNMNYIEGMKPFERGGYSLGFVSLGWEPKIKGTKFVARVLPEPIFSTILAATSESAKFDVKTSLKTGVITFQSIEEAFHINFANRYPSLNSSNGLVQGEIHAGRYFGNVTIIKPGCEETHTINHEFIHDLQFEEFKPLASLIHSDIKENTKSKKGFQNYLDKNKFYQPLFFDMSRSFGGILSLTAYNGIRDFYEFEADLTKKYLK